MPLTLWSCSRRLAETARWLNWLTAQHVGALAQVTQEHCERYLAQRHLRRDQTGAVIGTLEESVARVAAAVIIELARYGELFTADRYHERHPMGWPVVLPGRGHAATHAEQNTHTGTADPATDARRGPLPHRNPRAPRGGTSPPGPRPPRATPACRDQDRLPRPCPRAAPPHRHRLAAGGGPRRRHRRPPGPRLGSHRPTARYQYRCTGPRSGHRQATSDLLAAIRPLLEQTLSQVGTQKPWGRNAVPVSRADGAGTVAWTLTLDERDVRDLVGYTQTACLIIAATVTGLRASELMEL